MIINEFKNGNFHIKYDNDDVIPTSLDSCLVDMILNLDMSDMYLISETWESLSNFNAGVTVYNIRLDKLYIIADYNIAALRAGKMIILKGFKPDKYDREIINNYFNEE
jgi:hypothetical protein